MTVVEDVLRHWHVTPREVARPGLGTMNEIYLVDTQEGKLVLRGHRLPDRAAVEFEHAAMGTARAAQVPAPTPLRSTTGDLVVAHERRWWSLLTWMAGDQPERGTHTLRQAKAMGAMLGRVHAALESLPTPAGSPRSAEPTAETVRRTEELLSHIDGLADAGADEAAAHRWLAAQRDWLRLHTDDPEPKPGPEQTVHGDYHDANVVFEGDAVSGVLDWDKADRGSPLEELTRAMHLSFALEPRRCRAFLAGYRTVRPVETDELDGAARRYGFRRDRSIWLFDELYRGGNERLRPLLNDRPFAPFEVSWEAVRHQL
jgi:homoserine kinase type II